MTGSLGVEGSYLGNLVLGYGGDVVPSGTPLTVTVPASLVPRDAFTGEQRPRIRRFTEIVSEIVNELEYKGFLRDTPDGWLLFAGRLLTGHGIPAVTLGFNGDYYLDLDSGILYQNQ